MVVPAEQGGIGVAFGPDGDLYVATLDSGIRRFDGETLEPRGYFVEPNGGGLSGPFHIAFAPRDEP